MCEVFLDAQGLGAERCTHVRLVAGAGARARGADEHVVLHLLAVLPAVLPLRPDPGAVALDDLAVGSRRGPYGPRRSAGDRVLGVESLRALLEVDGAIRVLAVVQAHLCACCEVPRSVLLRQTCKIGVSSRANAPRAFSLARGRQE